MPDFIEILEQFRCGVPIHASLESQSTTWTAWRSWLAADPARQADFRLARAQHAEAAASALHHGVSLCMAGKLAPERLRASAGVLQWLTERVDPAAWAARNTPAVEVKITTNLIDGAASTMLTLDTRAQLERSVNEERAAAQSVAFEPHPAAIQVLAPVAQDFAIAAEVLDDASGEGVPAITVAEKSQPAAAAPPRRRGRPRKQQRSVADE